MKQNALAQVGICKPATQGWMIQGHGKPAPMPDQEKTLFTDFGAEFYALATFNPHRRCALPRPGTAFGEGYATC